MWNSFGEELLQRATNTRIKDIDISSFIPNSTGEKSKKSKKNKIQMQKNLEYLIDDNKIRFTQNMWEGIRSVTKTYNAKKVFQRKNDITTEESKCLRKLAIALMLLHMNNITQDKNGNDKYIAVVIYPSANGKLNKSVLSKMCRFTDNQRKNIDRYIKRLVECGLIEIGTGKLANIRIKIPYMYNADSSKDLIPNDIKKVKNLYEILKYLYKEKRL